MIIEDQVKRFWWRMLAVGVVVDLLIAFGLAWAFAEEGDRLVSTGIIWLILQALSIAMWLRYLLHATTAWKLGQAEIVEDAFLAELRRGNLPAPKQFESSVEGYLKDVMDDTELPADKRVSAAALAGMQAACYQSLGFVRGMMFTGAHERALKRFSERQTT